VNFGAQRAANLEEVGHACVVWVIFSFGGDSLRDHHIIHYRSLWEFWIHFGGLLFLCCHMFNTDNLVSSAGLFHQAVLLKEESKLYFILFILFWNPVSYHLLYLHVHQST